MRIGIDIRALQSAGGSATRGIGKYVIDLVEGLHAFHPEHELVLIGLRGRPLPDRLARGLEFVGVDGPIYQEVPKPWYLHIPKIRSNQTLLGRLHERAVIAQRSAFESSVAGARLDVLHLPTAVDVGSYPEGVFPCPVVMTFLDAIPVVLRSEYYDRWGRFLQRFYDRQLANLRNAAAVVAISEASRRDAITYASLSPERVVTIYPTVSDEFSRPVDPSEALATHRIVGPYFLFCSVPDPHKNPTRVIEAYAAARSDLTRPHQLVFVSPKDGPYPPQLRASADRLGIPESEFILTGRISDEALVALFQNAVALVSPSLIEGFGLPAAQAMAAGTPAIVSDRASQPEVVGDAAVVVDPEDTAAIARGIVTLANDPESRAALAERARARAPMFRAERQATELLALYTTVVDRAAATSSK